MLLLKNWKKNPAAKVAVLVIAFFISCANMVYATPGAPAFDMPGENFTDSGYIKIKWTEQEDSPSIIYQLEQSTGPDFNNPTLIYEGPDRASFISGLPDGNYYFRVRAVLDDEVSEWSPVVKVKVKHHSLTLAFSLASVGFLVFLLTIGVVVNGVKEDKKS